MQNNQAIPFNKDNFKQILSKEFAWVIVISIPGALIADYFSVPLAWFLGPMIVTSLLTLSGVKTKMPRLILSIVLIFLGLYIGNYIDQSLFSQMHQWVWTSLIMLAYIIISVLLVSGFGKTLTDNSVKTVKVPKDPEINLHKSYPVTFLTTVPPDFIVSPLPLIP